MRERHFRFRLLALAVALLPLLLFAAATARAQDGEGGSSREGIVGQADPVQPLDIDRYAPFDRSAFFDTFRHGTAQANGISQHYVIGGSGPVVVLLNGHPETWFSYHKVMPALAEAGYTALAVDVRGTGATSKPYDGYGAGNIVEDLRALLDELGLDTPINLAAYDITGRVGYAWAADYPGEVRRLVLFETLLPGFGLERAMNVARGGSWHFGFYANVDMATALVEGHEEEHLRTIIDGALADKDAMSEEALRRFINAYQQPSGTRGFYEHYAAFLTDAEPNRQRAARGLSEVPVLAMYGTGLNRDTGALPRSLTPLFEQIEEVGIEGSGHFIPEERPGAFAAYLIDFFGGPR